MHPLAGLAEKAVREYTINKKIIPVPEVLMHDMKEKAGVFVSLKKHGQLRGCIGTFLPVTGSVAEEIIRNAIASATDDPRFNPVEEDELEELTYSVDVLTTPEKITGLNELNPEKYGIIVASRGRKGLLLPDLEGIDTVAEQLRIAKMKAGIAAGDTIDIYRFEVRRYH